MLTVEQQALRLVAAMVFITLALSRSAWTVSPVASALDTQTTDERLTRARSANLVKGGRGGIGAADEFFSFAYGIPISWEWAYVDSSKRPLPVGDFLPSVNPGDSLRSALAAMSRKVDGKLVLDVVRGNLCVRAPEEAREDTENVLDRTVRFTVENVSTWHALMALAEAIKETGDSVPEILIYPSFAVHGRKGPPGFREGRDISLEFNDVTAREALCMIFEASPFEMSYRYWNDYRPQRFPKSKPKAGIQLTFFKSGEYYPFREREPLEDAVLYTEDFAKMKADRNP